MVLWVVERALTARHVARAIVATDDRRILEAVTSAGFEAMMTRSDAMSRRTVVDARNLCAERFMLVGSAGERW